MYGGIVVDVEDGLKFACIDFSSQQQKRRKALCIKTDLFLSFPITQPSFPINSLVRLTRMYIQTHLSVLIYHILWHHFKRRNPYHAKVSNLHLVMVTLAHGRQCQSLGIYTALTQLHQCSEPLSVKLLLLLKHWWAPPYTTQPFSCL